MDEPSPDSQALTEAPKPGDLSVDPVDVLVTGGQVGAIGDHATVNQVTPRRPVVWPVVVGSPPPLASAFRPRSSVLERMERTGEGPLRQVITGNGGVGKSQVAAGVFAADRSELRVWVAAESRTAVVTAYGQAAARLDLADPGVDPQRLADLFKGFLAGMDKTWLIVLDDLRDPDDLSGLWPDGQGRLLVTTRRRDASLSGGGRVPVEVGAYTEVEARTYLVERLTPWLGELPSGALDEVEGLAADLGYLPLALAHAAAVLIDQGITCGTYRTRFADRARTLDDLFPADADADGYAQTVASTWSLAVEAADRLNPSGLASPMARIVAMFDPVGTPENVFTSVAACQHLTASSARDTVTSDEARMALRALNRLSLISHRPQGDGSGADPRAVRMHNLTGRAILAGLPSKDLDALAVVAADCLLEAWPEIENSRPLSEALRSNSESIDRTRPGGLWDLDEGGHRVLFEAGHSLGRAGLVADAVAYWEGMLQQAHQRLGPMHSNALASRSNLAAAYGEVGDLKRAIELFKQTLADSEQALGASSTDILAARNNLAGVYESAGDPARAIAIYTETIADAERLLPPGEPRILTYRNNLAYAYRSAGDLVRAIKLFEQNLADRERLLPKDDPAMLTSRSNLAGAYEEDGDLVRAIAMHEQNLKDRVRVLGADHRDTLRSRNNLARALEADGDLPRAILMHEQTLSDRVRVLGADHPDTLSSGNSLARAIQASGDLARATSMFQETLANRDRVLGPDNPDTLASRNSLAEAYESGGDLARAIPLFEQTFSDRERVLGADHPDTVTSRASLDRVLHRE